MITLSLPPLGQTEVAYYLCTKENVTHPAGSGQHTWVHVGHDTHMQIEAYEKLIPLWLAIVIIVTCLGFSSLFSGLNLGLMSLNRTDLKIICNTGESPNIISSTFLSLSIYLFPLTFRLPLISPQPPFSSPTSPCP